MGLPKKTNDETRLANIINLLVRMANMLSSIESLSQKNLQTSLAKLSKQQRIAITGYIKENKESYQEVKKNIESINRLLSQMKEMKNNLDNILKSQKSTDFKDLLTKFKDILAKTEKEVHELPRNQNEFDRYAPFLSWSKLIGTNVKINALIDSIDSAMKILEGINPILFDTKDIKSCLINLRNEAEQARKDLIALRNKLEEKH